VGAFSLYKVDIDQMCGLYITTVFDRNTELLAPIELGANLIPRFYRGGARIAAFRGLAQIGSHESEDWIASTTHTRASEEIGLSRLDSGERLREVLEADPVSFLGKEHVARFGTNPGLLVKLLDAGERLPVHCHPGRDFAQQHLGSPYGKTEAWHVLRADPGARVYLGFRQEIPPGELAELVAEQPPGELLSRLNPLPVREGDTIFVPAGVPHSIGEGLLIIEVQEPTDHSVILEWAGYEIDGATVGHLRLGFETALDAVDRTAWDARRLAQLRVVPRPGTSPCPVLPERARDYFWLERIRPMPKTLLEPAFAVLVVTAGTGTLAWGATESCAVAAGQTYVIPHMCGPVSVSGDVEILRCLGPTSAHDQKELVA